MEETTIKQGESDFLKTLTESERQYVQNFKNWREKIHLEENLKALHAHGWTLDEVERLDRKTYFKVSEESHSCWRNQDWSDAKYVKDNPEAAKKRADEILSLETDLPISLERLEERRKKEMEALEKRFEEERNAIIQSWCEENARFRVGDAISAANRNNKTIRLRIETIKCYVRGNSYPDPTIYYSGKTLGPNLTQKPKARTRGIEDNGTNEIKKIHEKKPKP